MDLFTLAAAKTQGGHSGSEGGGGEPQVVYYEYSRVPGESDLLNPATPLATIQDAISAGKVPAVKFEGIHYMYAGDLESDVSLGSNGGIYYYGVESDVSHENAPVKAAKLIVHVNLGGSETCVIMAEEEEDAPVVSFYFVSGANGKRLVTASDYDAIFARHEPDKITILTDEATHRQYISCNYGDAEPKFSWTDGKTIEILTLHQIGLIDSAMFTTSFIAHTADNSGTIETQETAADLYSEFQIGIPMWVHWTDYDEYGDANLPIASVNLVNGTYAMVLQDIDKTNLAPIYRQVTASSGSDPFILRAAN